MGKPNFSPKQRDRRRSAWMRMKDAFARMDAWKCKRQQQKEYKHNEE